MPPPVWSTISARFIILNGRRPGQYAATDGAALLAGEAVDTFATAPGGGADGWVGYAATEIYNPMGGMGGDVKAIKCLFQSKCAQRYILLQLFPSAFKQIPCLNDVNVYA